MTSLRHIGNSMGILIPKSLINQAGLENHELILELKEDGILIKPVKIKRSDWKQKFEAILSGQQHDADQEWLDSNLTDSLD